MKYLSIALLLIIFGCSDKKEIPITTTPAKEPDSIATLIGNIYKDNNLCLNDIEMAKDSIKQNRLTYYVYRNNPSLGYHTDLLKKLLAPYHINCEKAWGGTCIPTIGRQDCYFEYMRETVRDKFKPGVIDSLETVAIKKALTMTNTIISYYEYSDKNLVYAGAKSVETQFTDCNRDFLSLFKYPKGFKFNKGKLWYSQGGVNVYKDGHIDAPSCDIKFTDTLNNKYKKYFETRIILFISKTKWHTVYGAGVAMNCYIPVHLSDKRD